MPAIRVKNRKELRNLTGAVKKQPPSYSRQQILDEMAKRNESQGVKGLIKPGSEDAAQADVIRWCSEEETLAEMPEIALLYAIPNGAHTTRAVRAVLSMTGRKSGVPDLHLPVARQGFHGLYIEMKTEKGSLEPNQKKWAALLREQGHRVECCKGAEAAKAILRDYLKRECRSL